MPSGSEIEQAQVRLISAANAQMLCSIIGRWAITYCTIRTDKAGAVRSSRNWRRRYGSTILKRKGIRSETWLICASSHAPIHWGALRSFIETDAKLLTPSVQKITDELQSLNNMKFTQEPLAQIQSSDNKEIAIVQEPLAQIQDVAQTVATSYQIPIEDMEKLFLASPYRKNQLGKPCDSAKQVPFRWVWNTGI